MKITLNCPNLQIIINFPQLDNTLTRVPEVFLRKFKEPHNFKTVVIVVSLMLVTERTNMKNSTPILNYSTFKKLNCWYICLTFIAWMRFIVYPILCEVLVRL